VSRVDFSSRRYGLCSPSFFATGGAFLLVSGLRAVLGFERGRRVETLSPP
jgi:hypothetical protein